ncbi:MlaA family lipoprotein [Fusobacterium sp. PH5-44]|uniref:MlaA family lipoprotein n=1 Tax=unclassified Fusobacterium TaxID=2648384 RepID=UPI003D22B496
MKKSKILKLSFVFIMILSSFESFSSDYMTTKSKNNYSSVNRMKIYDPLEPMNRRIYYFNYGFDKYIFIPVVNAYKFVTPNVVQKGIRNFSKNNKMIPTATNSLMQGKVKKAMRAIGRFTMNSTVGVGGTIDVASSMGMPVPHEDFGLTLAHYGVRRGPYLMLPLIGPSNLRDTLGKGVDSLNPIFLDPYEAMGFKEISSAPVTIVTAIDARSTLDFRYYSSGSPFEYEYLRFLFVKYRDIQEKASKKPDIIHIRRKEKK